LAYIVAADSMGLHSFIFLWLVPKDAFCCGVRIGRSRQGHWFWYQWKAHNKNAISC